MLGGALRVDFEGDQFTFLKPWPQDLESLYGVDIHEMQPYRDLREQAVEQLDAGRTVIVEVDALHLPDTAATSYGASTSRRRSRSRRSTTRPSGCATSTAPGCTNSRARTTAAGFRSTAAREAELPPYLELARFDAGNRPRRASSARSRGT